MNLNKQILRLRLKQSLASFTGKKIVAFVLSLVVLGVSFAPAVALAEDKGKDATPGARPGLLRFFEGNGRAAIGSGIVVSTSKGTNSLVVTKDSKNITINVSDKTQFRRRFWGKGTFDEIQVGDTVNVIGQWTDSSHTAINATLIRDLSIQKRAGVFFGTIKSISGSVWVMTTVNRGEQTVTVDSLTKLIDRKGQTINASDIKEGHRIRVRGLWDKTASTITQVTQVKDFDLPVKPTPMATP